MRQYLVLARERFNFQIREMVGYMNSWVDRGILAEDSIEAFVPISYEKEIEEHFSQGRDVARVLNQMGMCPDPDKKLEYGVVKAEVLNRLALEPELPAFCKRYDVRHDFYKIAEILPAEANFNFTPPGQN